MGMRKIFFGTIVFFSMAFLAACGGGSSGSSGAAGAAGAAGADGAAGAAGTDGATGSITAFADTHVAHFNGAAGAAAGSTPTAVPLDSGAVVGKLSGILVVTGTDNLTADSKNDYRVYTETSAGLKRVLGNSGTAPETGEGPYGSDGDGILDTRLRTLSSDNVTVTLADYILLEGVAGTTYATAAISVCSGNEAGTGACSKVLAPAYDRGIGTISPMQGYKLAADLDAGQVLGDLMTSITYIGSSFHVLSDNATPDNGSSYADGATIKDQPAAIGRRFTHSKASYASATTSDNTSAPYITPAWYDNDTRVSNIISRTSASRVCFAMANDNTTKTLNWGGDGDNVTMACRENGTASFADNGTVLTHHAALSVQPQLADAGDGAYLMLGSGTAIANYHVFMDNGTVTTLGAVTAGVADTWCSTSDVSTYAVIAHDNATTGWFVDQVYDNTSTFRTTTGDASLMGTTISPEQCGLAHLAGTTYLAVTDETGASDNVSVFKSTDLATWTQIGSDFTVTSDATRIAVATTGTSASDQGVWVVVNDAGNIEILHYEDIAGGTDYAWRSVASPITSADNESPVGIATDGTSIIAVTATVSSVGNVGFWHNQ